MHNNIINPSAILGYSRFFYTIKFKYMFQKNFIKLIVVVLFAEIISVNCSNNYSSSHIKSTKTDIAVMNCFNPVIINNGIEEEFDNAILEERKSEKKKFFNYNFGKYIQNIKKTALGLISIYALYQIPRCEAAWIEKLQEEDNIFKGNIINMGSDNNFWVAGKEESNSKGVYSKYTKNGNLEYTKKITGIDEIKYIKELSSKDLAVAGIIVHSNGLNDIGIARITPESDYSSFTYCKSMGGIYDDEPVFLYELSNTSLITSGTTTMTVADGKDAVVFSLDHEGKLKWISTYGDENDNVAKTSTISSLDSNLLISGHTQENTESIFFTSVDPYTGNMDSYSTEIRSSRNISANHISPTEDEEVLFTGYIRGNSDLKSLLVGKVGNNGGGPISWISELSKVYNNSNNSSIEGFAILEKEDNSIVVISHLIDYNNLYSSLGDIVICNLDSDGSFKEAYILGGDSLDIARSILLTPENKLAIFGDSSSFSDYTGFLLALLHNTGEDDCTSSVKLNQNSLILDTGIYTLGFTQNSLDDSVFSSISCTSSHKSPYSHTVCSNENEEQNFFDEWYFWPIVGVAALVAIICCCCFYCICIRRR